jgi:hypothetical protein
VVAFAVLIWHLDAPDAPLLVGITVLFGCVLPLVTALAMLRLNFIDDIYAEDRESRYVPFLWTDLFYLIGVVALNLANAPPAVTALMSCYFVNGLVLLLITFRYKISIHASGVTGPVTALVYIIGLTMIPLFLFLIPVAWARVELDAHTKWQVTAGAVVTGLLTWLQMSLWF